jgi:chromosome transmission fidelity protein 1
LKNSIVIVDEAHNLLDTISQIHGTEMSSDVLNYAVNQVNQYCTRYSSRLLPKNLLYIKQVKFILSKLKKILDSTKTSKLMSTYEFINEAEIFNLDLIKLIKYIEKSKLAQKVGFLADYLNSDNGKENEKKRLNSASKKGVNAFLDEVKKQNPTKSKDPKAQCADKEKNVQSKKEDKVAENVPTSSTTPIIQVTALLKALISVHCEGRILISATNTECEQTKSIKYMLLNPSSQFVDIISECRSIIVAGGTMQPLSEFRDQLFLQAGAEPDRVMHFSCDHVVPGDNILPIGTYYKYCITYNRKLGCGLLPRFWTPRHFAPEVLIC